MELLWINTYKYKKIRGWTSSELPAILGFTKGTRFLPIPIYEYLLGGWPTPLKNMSSSVGVIIPNIWKVIKFHGSKPPTSIHIVIWCREIREIPLSIHQDLTHSSQNQAILLAQRSSHLPFLFAKIAVFNSKSSNKVSHLYQFADWNKLQEDNSHY